MQYHYTWGWDSGSETPEEVRMAPREMVGQQGWLHTQKGWGKSVNYPPMLRTSQNPLEFPVPYRSPPLSQLQGDI